MHGWGGHGRHQQHRREVSATLGGLGRLRGGAWPLVGRQFAHTARNANTSRQAIGYVRVSTEQQADSGLSIAAQRVKLEALAVLNDYQLIDVVVDAGASAKSLDRPGWQRVMGAVHGRQVGAVLIAKLDRCTRSVADLASLIDTFSRRGVALISAAESLDTSSAGGRLVVNVLGAVAQWEREATAERTSAALQVLKQQGRATGGVKRQTECARGRGGWPASHGRRWPTSSAPPGTALVPAASGRGRAPTRSTRRANATTKRQRRSGGGRSPPYAALRH